MGRFVPGRNAQLAVRNGQKRQAESIAFFARFVKLFGSTATDSAAFAKRRSPTKSFQSSGNGLTFLRETYIAATAN